MHSKAKGDYGSAVVLAECMKKGYTASIPFGDSARYDMIIERSNGKLERVQIKTVSPVNGTLVVPLKTMQYVAGTRGNNRSQMRMYNADEIDVVIAVDMSTGLTYWLPTAVWVGKTGITLRFDEMTAAGKPSTNWASNFLGW